MKLLTVLGAMSGYNSAFMISPFSIVNVTIGFCAIVFLPFCLIIVYDNSGKISNALSFYVIVSDIGRLVNR